MWALVFLFAFAIYWPSLHGDFLLDDLPFIQGNGSLWAGAMHKIKWNHWRSIPKWTIAAQIHMVGPVNPGQPIPQRLSFALHSGNVLLHALTACVAGAIVATVEPGLAFWSAMLWVAMPVAVHSVAYMSSRATLLAGLFSLSALWCVFKGGSLGALAVPLILLAIASKEDHAGLPFGLSGVCLFHGHVVPALVFFAMPLGFAFLARKRLAYLLRVSSSPNLGHAGVPDPMPSDSRSLTAIVELLCRWPQWIAGVGLCIMPFFKRPSSARIAMAGCIALVGVGSFFLLPGARLPLWLMATSPLPLYALFARVHDPVMDYRCYSAMIGPFLLMLPHAASWQLILLLLGWAAYSGYRAFDWTTPLALWRGAIRDGSGPIAWINLGAAHQMRREFTEAKSCYDRCLADYPDTGVVLLNLGLIEGMEGRTANAAQIIERCVELHPHYVSAWRVLSQIYEATKDEPNLRRCRERMEALA